MLGHRRWGELIQQVESSDIENPWHTRAQADASFGPGRVVPDGTRICGARYQDPSGSVARDPARPAHDAVAHATRERHVDVGSLELVQSKFPTCACASCMPQPFREELAHTANRRRRGKTKRVVSLDARKPTIVERHVR